MDDTDPTTSDALNAPSAPIPGAAEGAAADAKREAILTSALDVFAVKGFKGATIKAIAQAADLRSPALLYWYFPNKEELFRAVLWRFLPVLSDEQLTDPSFDQPPEVFLRDLMASFLERFAQPSTTKAFWLLVREHALLADAGFSMSAERPGNVHTLVVDYLRHQIDLGRLRPHDPEAVARLLTAQLNLVLQNRTAPMGLLPMPADDDTVIDQTLDVLLDGIRPR